MLYFFHEIFYFFGRVYILFFFPKLFIIPVKTLLSWLPYLSFSDHSNITHLSIGILLRSPYLLIRDDFHFKLETFHRRLWVLFKSLSSLDFSDTMPAGAGNYLLRILQEDRNHLLSTVFPIRAHVCTLEPLKKCVMWMSVLRVMWWAIQLWGIFR